MSQTCTHDCSNCTENCQNRETTDFLKKTNDQSHVKKVIGVMSGKGGVGKSMVTSLLASALQKKGYRTAIMDADITGPSIPKAFGIHGYATGDEKGIFPAETPSGLKVMSLNLLVEHETDPVVWRGPVIAGMVGQFWTDVYWGDVDFMLVDLPPGTGDVVLTAFQSIPLSGVIVVSTPQQLVGMIVEKAVNMANMMSIPVIGMVENMSYVTCPHCTENYELFGPSRLVDTASQYGVTHTAKLPINPVFAKLIDDGKIEEASTEELEDILNAIIQAEPRNV